MIPYTLLGEPTYANSTHPSIIKRNATEDNYNCYMLEQMLDTYHDCAIQCGKGTRDRMHKIMAAHMRKGIILTNIRHRIRTETRALFDQTAASLREKLGGVCDQVDTDLAVLRGSEATQMERDPVLLNQMERIVDDAKSRLAELERAIEPAQAEARRRSYI